MEAVEVSPWAWLTGCTAPGGCHCRRSCHLSRWGWGAGRRRGAPSGAPHQEWTALRGPRWKQHERCWQGCPQCSRFGGCLPPRPRHQHPGEGYSVSLACACAELCNKGSSTALLLLDSLNKKRQVKGWNLHIFNINSATSCSKVRWQAITKNPNIKQEQLQRKTGSVSEFFGFKSLKAKRLSHGSLKRITWDSVLLEPLQVQEAVAEACWGKAAAMHWFRNIQFYIYISCLSI